MIRTNREKMNKLFQEAINVGSIQKAQKAVLLAEENYFLDYAFFLRAFIKQVEKNYPKAIELYKKVIEINPSFPGAYNGIGNGYLALENYDEAIKWYNEYIKTFSLTDRSVPFYNRALAYAGKKEYEKAISSSLMSIENNKSYSRPYLSLLNMYFTLGKISNAIKVADEILKVFEKDQETLAKLGERCYQFGSSLETSGETKKANQWYEMASKADPVSFYVALSYRYLEERELEKAFNAINKALDVAPADVSALYSLACYYSLQQTEGKAIDTLKKAIQVQPDIRKKARKDTDFNYLKQFPKFRELVSNQKTKAKV